MSFFYDLNKKLDSIRATPEVTHQQLNERDMSQHAKGIEKYTKPGMEKLSKLGREGASKAKMTATRKEFNQYDNEEVAEGGQNFGPGDAGPNKNQAGPSAISPDAKNYKIPNTDQQIATSRSLDKMAGQGYSAKNFPGAGTGAWDLDARGQNKYVDRTTPGVINKIKDKLGLDMPDPAYGPKPDERERLAKRYPAPAKSVDEGGEVIDGVYKLAIEPKRPEEEENKMTRGTRPKSNKSNQLFPPMRLPSDEKFPPMRLPKGDERVFPPMRLPTDENLIPVPAKPKSTVDKQIDKAKTPPPYRPSKSAPKGEFMGTIKGGVWTADPPKPGEKGVPVPKNHERVPEAGAPMTAKRKFTFADKIAGAKKEVDEMLGDVAAEAMRSALGGGRGRNAEMDESAGGFTQADWDKVARKKRHLMMLNPNLEPEDAEQIAAEKLGYDYEEVLAWIEGDQNMEEAVKERSKGTAFDMSTRKVDTPKAGSTERGAKHDIKHSTSDPRYTGRTVTRRTDAQGISVGADDDSDTQAGPRGRGRPKGTKGAIGAKGPSGKSKLMTKEGDQDITDQGEYDQEGDMAKDDIKTIMRHAQALSQVLGDNDNLPEWVQSKLAKIEGMMISIDEYMQNQEDEEEPIAEKAVSKKQQRFMGMVHSAQKGEKPASRAVGKVANTMKPKDTADFAKTKHKGLPEKKKKEVDENSEEGRLTVKQTGPGQTSTSSSTGRISATVDKGTVSVKPAKSGGMSYGKGIYDSINLELENMIAESMSINMSDSTDGNKSLTITATDEDAMKLAMILKSAGLGGGDQRGDMHGHMVDENAPDYPTNTQTSNDALQYAGGLNKPKTDVAGDGQTTVPNTAVHTQEEDALRRMMEMAGLAEAAKPDFLDINKNGNKEESMKDAAADVNEEEDTVEESIRRMMEIAGIKEAKKQVDQNGDGENNFKDVQIARMKASGAIDDKEEKKVDESIFALTNQWKAYKG